MSSSWAEYKWVELNRWWAQRRHPQQLQERTHQCKPLLLGTSTQLGLALIPIEGSPLTTRGGNRTNPHRGVPSHDEGGELH
jgi:hypothetical protein